MNMGDDVIMKEASVALEKAPIYDPLEFDLDHAIHQLQSIYQSIDQSQESSTASSTTGLLRSIDFTPIQKYINDSDAVQKSQVLDTVARYLLYRPWTLKIVEWFRPIAIDLLSRIVTSGFMDFITLDNVSATNTNLTVYKLELVAKTFATTLPIVPQVKSLVVSYFSHSPSLLERLNHLPHDYSTQISPSDVIQIQDLLFTAYKLLHISPTSFARLWNWGPLVPLLSCPHEAVRYLTCLCLSNVYGLNDIQTKNLLNSIVGSSIDESEEPLMAILDGTRIDLRMLSLWEQQNIANSQIALLHNKFQSASTTHSSASTSASGSTSRLTTEDLSSLTTNLCGVLMAKPVNHGHVTSPSNKDPQLIITDTTARNLHAIALALSIGAPTLLEGVTGAGKTTLVEELAIRTGRGDQLVKIHLGDQTDPKVLLGTYVSTSTPGSFRWQAGVLTTAVQEGRWVLIEDIDLAPAEVISVLLPLLETRHLFIPSRGEEIKAKEGFHLFGTRSLIPSRSGKSFSSRGGDLVAGANLWTRVHVNALSLEELELVVRQKFNHIGDFSRHVMALFETVVNVYQDPKFASLSSSSVGRFISTRDLMKWCYRIDTLLGARLGMGVQSGQDVGMDESIRQDVFSEAIDCFCGMISDYNTWVMVLEKIGEPLQISQAMVRHYVDQYKPAFDVSDTNVHVGRVNLTSIAASGRQKQKQSMVKREKKRPFATTGHALRLLEKIAVSVHLTEPVLLVGETGTGKTTVVQHLADMMHQNLVVVNLSQQSDSSDLLGGFKPVDGKVLAIPLREEFEKIFEKTFSVKKNAKFLDVVRKTFVHQKWNNFVALLKQSIKMSQQKFQAEDDQPTTDDAAATTSSKRISSPQLRQAWKTFGRNLEAFEVQQVQSENKFVFNFMEGSLVKAVRQGDWILMDEINLATTETLECLSGLLEDAEGSLLLTEKGDVEPIKRHPNFRLFACMNPATDVGKRDLPPGLRNRFTEFYVHSPDSRYEDLLQIVRQYILPVATGDERACDDVAQFYMEAKKLSQMHKLVDGANQRPHFSIRTLSRALTYVVQIYPTYGLRRSLYEGFCMTFLTQLNKESETLLQKLMLKTILSNVTNSSHLITQIPRQPASNFIQFGYFWLEEGQHEPIDDPHYIMTPSVETKLYNLARVIMSRKFPVLIQGPTSAGKTSMIEYLAKKTGHRFVRINNHEHTDLQEYLGTYVSNSDGKLVFQEGVLVEALRNGYWIVLDELNLAPSDVLEALNRLLDDNRELLIPETQEVVKPHPHFMLFATQNPAGLYGGRKALSRAFRNRFLELHFDDIPEEELETILSKRCQIAPSYCKRLVQVYRSLMERRQSTRIFEQRHGFITLRDLFRWAGRDPQGYQELAEHGYMLLAERCRRDEEKAVVKEVLETVMKVKLNESEIYDTSRLEEFAVYDQMLKNQATQTGEDTALVWTKAMKRLFTLVARCLKYNEPVLLVGDTGCGKTTVCQMLAETYGRELHIVNCHQNTETGDLLGGQRPVRQNASETADEAAATDDKQKPLFEWHDGPLVQSMRDGHLFLLDEISLADDSVLERLNSVLEPSRLLVLAEKGGKHVEELHGAQGFQFLATMNPGGDYGKKELSPALRNRFTEIWVPAVTDRDDLLNIIGEQISHPGLEGYAAKMLDFIGWYMKALGQSRTVVSLRDILSWVKFMNTGVLNGLDAQLSYAHGACIVLLDGLGSHGSSGSFLAGSALKEFRLKCLRQLANDTLATEKSVLGCDKENNGAVSITEHKFTIGPFHIPRGALDKADIKFTLLAPTTGDNAMRVIRSMQLQKPILLEGSPGVGKTSLVSALAAASGHNLVRINLSEQTDLMDLFGSDLPVEGGNSGEFAWRDAPFLQAMKAGDWVLLDELNLASQSVLEGLNSCLDHRGAVYIPELDREFFCAHGFRVFGAQNPLQQGGGRKGLPKSFVNRFTQVYVEQLTADDLLFICTHLFPEFTPETLQRMITFNTAMYHETMVRCSFGRKGSPWEFNLRDVFRWLELMQKNNATDPMEFLDTIYMQRMRTHEDRLKVVDLFESVFECKYSRPQHPDYSLTPDRLVIGHSSLPRTQGSDDTLDAFEHQDHVLQSFLSPLESLIKCVESSWMAIVTGPSASGKTSLVRLLSKMTGNKLEEFAMNNSVDTMELLGGFEQVDLNRHRQVIVDTLRCLTNRGTKCLLDHLSTIPASQENERQTTLQHIRQLSDAWFALENQQHLRYVSDHHAKDALDYTLVSAVLNCINVTCSMDSEASSSIAAVVNSTKQLQKLEKNSVAGKFEWIDGLLINALENGHWLLIDNANLCNPSVLDRLNPLFENDGVLMVNERGLVDGTVKVITPHPNFRMFMTVDPQNGELSRAMRNRGIEIALVDSQWNNNIQDVTKLTNSMGLRGPQLPLILNNLQDEAAAKRKHYGKNKNVRDYLLLTSYIVERLQRGQDLKESVKESFYQVFVDIKDVPESLTAFLEMDSEADILQSLLSPTNCPIFVGGDLCREDSRLAMVAIQGAYLLNLLQQREPAQFETDDDKRLEKQHLCHVDIAGDFFMESMSLDDYGVRLRWLAFISQQYSINVPHTLERLSYLIKTLRSHPLFMELHHSIGDEYEKSRKTYTLFVRLCKQEYAMMMTRNTSQRLKVASLTVIQQSLCLQEGRLSASQLLHPVVAELYPFFAHVNNTLVQWIDRKQHESASDQIFDSLANILDLYDFAWELTQSNNLPLDNLLIVLRSIKGLMMADIFDSSFFGSSCDGIDRIMSSFDFETSRSMKELWKHFGPATLSSEKLYGLEQELLNVNSVLDPYQAKNDQKLTGNHPIMNATTELKETLIEGIATLYALDENNDKDAKKLAQSLEQLPEFIRSKLPSNDLETMTEETCWHTALMPLYDYTSIVKEMELISILNLAVCQTDDLQKVSSSIVEKLKKLRTFSLDKTSRPPLDMVPYQRLLWLLDSDYSQKTQVVLPGLIQDAAHHWQQRLWRSSVIQSDLHQLTSKEKTLVISDGSLNLFENVESLTCLNLLCSVNYIATDMLDTALKQLKDLKLFLASHVNVMDRFSLELVMLISMSYQLFTASLKSISSDAYDSLLVELTTILSFANNLSQVDAYNGKTLSEDEISQVNKALENMVLQLTEHKFNGFYISAMTSLSDSIRYYLKRNDTMFFTSAGKTRTLLGLSFVACYVPDYPADPTAEPRLHVNLLTRKKQQTSDIIDARYNIETITTGNETNSIMETEKSKLADVNNQLSTTLTTFSLRPKQSQLDDIFVDLRYLQSSMLDKNVETLVHDLQHDLTAKETVIQREQLLQGNALQFIDRIQSKYPLYRDILQPLLVAVDDIKYGLRLMTSLHIRDSMDGFLAQVIQLLIRDPDAAFESNDLDWHTLATPTTLNAVKSVIFERAPTSRKWAFYLQLLIVVLQHLVIGVYNNGYIQAGDLDSLNIVFSEIVYIWKSAEEYKRQKDAEKEQLYKTRAKKYESATDEELEEMDMKKVFADFNDDFEDLTLDDDMNKTKKPVPTEIEEESVLDAKDIQQIGQLHKMLFDDFQHNLVARHGTKNWNRETLQSYAIAGQLSNLTTTAFGNASDRVCHAGHLRATDIAIRRLESSESSSITSNDIYDFYTSENVGEAKLVEPVLRRFKVRVKSILSEWPEHAVLQQLVTICDRILSFSITSPVAKFLTGVELLLQKSEDWEAYAAKHVSIKTEREELISMIIRWRQLELNCWPKLLAVQEQTCQGSVFNWWFHLYDAVNNSNFAGDNEDEIKKNTSELLAALDQFMQSSSLIEFEPRLKMVDSFYRQTLLQARVASSDDERKNYVKISTILRNSHLYYSQFKDHAEVMLKQLRKPIEKDLKDYVKIATWKDVNIYALKQSAYKTHRQLHKCIRKYRDVLNNSMLTVIANYNEERAMFQYGDEKRYNDGNRGFMDQLAQSQLWITSTTVPTIEHVYDYSTAPEVKRHLLNLSGTLSRMQDVCREFIFVSTQKDIALPLESFVTEIIGQIKNFQKETPAVMTDENKSMVKNQKLLKKKAMVDFLKELKRLGLKWRASGTLVQQNADTSILFVEMAAALDKVLAEGVNLVPSKLSSFCGLSQEMMGIWTKAGDYYFRSIARLTHLRSIGTTQVSKDLSMLEVERSMAATEHMFHLVTKERSILARFEESMQVLQGASIQLASLFDLSSTDGENTSLSTDSRLGGRLTTHKLYVDQITFMLQQAMATMNLQTTAANSRSSLDQVHGLWNILIKMQKQIDHVFGQRYLYPQTSTGVVLLSDDVSLAMNEEIKTLSTVSVSLLEIAQENQHFCHVLYPIINQVNQYLEKQQNEQLLQSSPVVDDDELAMIDLRDISYSLVDAILVAVQDLKKAKTPAVTTNTHDDSDVDDETDDMDDNYIKSTHQRQFTLVNALHLEILVKRSVNLLSKAHEFCLTKSTASKSQLLWEIKNRLQQVYPFLQQYMWMVQHTLGEILVHHKALAKMTYCLINSFTIIISKGFCMPEGASDEEEGEADGTATGTGIGEGEGNKDVSEQIEDEEQVLGTQNEEQSKDDNKPETKEEKNGMDMENDFEGQLEDMEPDEDQDESDSDSDSDEDPDEQIGDVDDMDPDAVDDKMWGEEAEENLKESDKTVDQGQNQQEQKESDIVAQEEDNQPPQQNQGDKADDKSEQAEQKDETTDQAENDDQQGDDEGEDEEGAGEDEDAAENQAGEKMNADIPEAETLELPDDLDLDGDDNNEDQGDDQNEEFQDSMDIDEPTADAMPEEGEEDGQDLQDSLDNAPQEAVEDDQQETAEDGDQDMDDATAQVKDEGEEPEEPQEDAQQEPENNGDMEQQDQQQQGMNIEEDEEQQETKGQNREQPNSDAIADNQFGVQGEAGKSSTSSSGQKEGEDDNNGENDDDQQNDMQQKNDGVADRGTNQAQDQNERPADDDKERKDNTKTNPQRSLGDALESWRRRLGDVADQPDEDENADESQEKDKEDAENTDAQVNEDNAFEYVKNDEDSHDLQTMGNASADQLQDLKLGAMDEEMGEAADDQHVGEEMDEDEHMESTIDTMPLPKESLDYEAQADSEQRGGVITGKQLSSNESMIDGDEEEKHGLTVDESVIARDPLDQQDIERMREELESKVSEWREEGRDIQQARDLWQGYENLTHDLAMGLCEQLRLILEPTLATKLKGDYRTGKRLNMKKIIPYIASQFKKDKIWLRRTKPSKRQYQVMISVDDSKSMSESHSVQLAYETLSLISKAMSQLEVGDVCITSFGESIRLLHPFDQPFTAESGASVLQQFTFAQEKTYVKNLVESSLALFENAQGGASHNSELWQLQLIISDGICEDHDTLKALVQRAMEERVMIIFIVVDNKPEKDSILNMTNVKYSTVNGKMSLKMTSYLETFPFQYFMVLRDINSLPEALSDALRQYFSFVAA